MDEHLRHDEDALRYVWLIEDDVVATMEYRPVAGRIVVHHTYTEPAMRGRGIAERLVRAALDDLRTRHVAIVPTCWFVAEFIDAHPEYRDLLAS